MVKEQLTGQIHWAVQNPSVACVPNAAVKTQTKAELERCNEAPRVLDLLLRLGQVTVMIYGLALQTGRSKDEGGSSSRFKYLMKTSTAKRQAKGKITWPH